MKKLEDEKWKKGLSTVHEKNEKEYTSIILYNMKIWAPPDSPPHCLSDVASHVGLWKRVPRPNRNITKIFKLKKLPTSDYEIKSSPSPNIHCSFAVRHMFRQRILNSTY